MKSLLFTERAFRGLDQSRDATDLTDGYLSQADNVVIDGNDLVTRPGKRGQLSTALNAPLFALTASTDSDGTPAALFASGGALYKWRKGGTTASSLGLSGLASDSVQLALAAGLAWLVDGAGVLRRYNMADASATAQTELDKPDRPSATLSSSALLSGLGALSWTQNYITGAATDPATSGTGGTVAPASAINSKDMNFWHNPDGDAGAEYILPFWNAGVGDPTFSPILQPGNGENAVELDSDTDIGESVYSDPILLNAANESGYARVAVFSYEAAAASANNDNTEVLDAWIQAYSTTDFTTEITGAKREHRSPFLKAGESTQIQHLIDLRGLSAVPRSLKLSLVQPYSRVNSDRGGTANRARLLIPKMELGVAGETSGYLTVRQGSVQVWQGPGATLTSSGAVGGQQSTTTTTSGRLLTSGLKLTTALGSSQNWTGVRTVALEVLPSSGVLGLALRVGFKVGSTWYYSTTLDIPTGGGWASGEISAVASSLNAVTHVSIEVLDDLLVENLQEKGDAALFRLGELRNVGNLAEGRPVWYTLVELDEAGDSSLLNVIRSDGSKFTETIEPDAGNRMGRVTIPARTTAGAEWFALYRFGGTLLSGVAESANDSVPASVLPAQGRLVCMVRWDSAAIPTGSDADKGVPPRIVALGNPYISWSPTGSTGDGGTILDNTPDSWLESAEVYIPGREPAPTAPGAVAAWDNRLWVAQGAELFASWILEPHKPAGVYWSRISLPDSQDPEATRKGWWAALDMEPGDSILSLVALEYVLIVVTRRSVWAIRKSESTRDRVRYKPVKLEDEDATGAVGHMAVCGMGTFCYWLAYDGLRRTDGRSVSRFGGELKRLIQPETVEGASPLSPDAMALCSLRSTPTRLYLTLPTDPANTVPDCVLVWHDDQPAKGWTRWTNFQATSAADIGTVPTLAGRDGQLWAMQSEGDKATPSASASAVSVVIGSRLYGDGFSTLIPQRQWVEILAGGDGSMTLTTRGDRDAGAAVRILPFETGNKTLRWRPSTSARGKHNQVKHEASTVKRLRIRQFGLETSVYKESDT